MLAFLLALFFIQLVSAEWMSEIPHAPSRWYSKLLGLPTWIAEIQGKKNEKGRVKQTDWYTTL